MCGIIGSINFSFNREIVDNSMGHRGPDERNYYTFKNVNLYHLRLSIQDIAGGKQPMHLNDKYSIIYNGEIYNHSELRYKYNLKCKTNSDTEIILHLYDLLGPKFLNEMDGMFAIAILDKLKNQIFIARDRAGKKPLYYYKDNEKFVFASELKCLKSILPLEIDEVNISKFLRFGFFYNTNTPYVKVEELSGGHYLRIALDTLHIEKTKWWNIADFYKLNSKDDFETAMLKTEFYLDQAVKRRITSSDLEVGSFLSGGIDSGLITSLASKYNSSLRTFTVAFKGQYDESKLAKLVADRYQTKHTEINISFDNLKYDLESILTNYGEPFFDSSAIPSYYVSKEAKRYLTVILNGDGSDEIFGGYRRYVPFAKFDFFKSNEFIKTFAKALKSIIPLSNSKNNLYNYLFRLINFSSKDGLDIYLSATTDVFEDYRHILLSGDSELKEIEYSDIFKNVLNSNMSGLKKVLDLDFNLILFGDLLVKMDIATMANSIEGRSPFLSKELLEYIPTIKDSYKIKGSTTKFLLRELAKKYLPEQILHQPKRGFEVPLKKWINKDLKDPIFSVINSTYAYHKQFINSDLLNKLLNNKIRVPEEKKAKIIWIVYCLDVWYKNIYN